MFHVFRFWASSPPVTLPEPAGGTEPEARPEPEEEWDPPDPDGMPRPRCMDAGRLKGDIHRAPLKGIKTYRYIDTDVNMSDVNMYIHI